MCTVIHMFHEFTPCVEYICLLSSRNRDWALIFFVNREWALIFFVNREQYPFLYGLLISFATIDYKVTMSGV